MCAFSNTAKARGFSPALDLLPYPAARRGVCVCVCDERRGVFARLESKAKKETNHVHIYIEK